MLESNFVMSNKYLFLFSIKRHNRQNWFNFWRQVQGQKNIYENHEFPFHDFLMIKITKYHIFPKSATNIYIYTRLPSLICILIYSRILLTSWLLHVLWDSKNLQQLGDMTGTQLSKTGQVIGWDVCWQWEIYNLTVKALICVCKVKLKTHEISTSGHTNDIFKFANFKK